MSAAIKRHVILAVPRVVLAAWLVFSLPFVRPQHPPSDDNPMEMVRMFIIGVGLCLAVLIIAGGFLAQILLRAKPLRYTVLVEAAWLLLIGAVVGVVTLIHD